MDENKEVAIGCLIVNHLAIEFIIETSTHRVSLISAEKDKSLSFHFIGFLELDVTGGNLGYRI